MTTFEIVKKLIGPINPVGCSSRDEERFENLKNMIELMDQIHSEIDDIAYRNRESREHSIKRSVDYINVYLNKLGIIE